MTKTFGILVAMGLAGGLAVSPLAAVAVDDSEDIIKYRKKAMSSQGGHMGAMAQIMRGKVSFRDHMKAHAVGVAGVAAHVKAMFPEGSDFGMTKAKMAVWEERAEFEEKADESEQAANELVAAVESGDEAAMGKAFKALGETCKGCHKKFREEDD